ncbi:Toll [Frankliniella occidentalis]|uniref:Toll-like receptor 6 n=1 Tax=Frankliniella occidentalis TaxID=133901 RepID=A0A6J1SGS7_FRAOC|nr:toll-like receptor 6 [Frankliniella occidentalis]KAE8751204.1 Toll [Frankliniella occidentalis]
MANAKTTMMLLWISAALLACAAARSVVLPSDAPRDCEWVPGAEAADGADVSLSESAAVLACKLRTIGGTDGLLANLTAQQAERVTALRLECSDVLFFESSLEEPRHAGGGGGFLGQLRALRRLSIEHCKIRYVPGSVLAPLRDLRHLSIRTHNTDWSAMAMEFNSESFRGLAELRSLDLADNNVWTMPPELFCPLSGLTHLNLSRNKLQNAMELGFSDWGEGPAAPGKSCNAALEELDLSSNALTALPDNGFTSLRSLQKLFLQDNAIAALADRAFVGLVALQTLNVSSNRLSALPPELFQSSRDLRELHLHNNSISVLAPGLLEGLDQLQVLDLSGNELSSSCVNRDTFSGLVRLVVLNLAHNVITRVDAQVFQDLYSLQILSLDHNGIEVIAEGAFSALSNLHALTLSHNNLVRLESYHFSGLYVLHQLYVDHNRLQAVHAQAFENCSNMQDLSMAGNNLTEVPAGLTHLHFLKTLDMGENRITTLSNESFHGLDQLYGLRLIDNRVRTVPKDTFSALPSLQILNLADNQVETVERGAFGTSPTLHAIRLDGNRLTDISDMFHDLPGLVWLNVSANAIAWFDYALLPNSLEWLDMHQNRIERLKNYFEKDGELQIKMLDASYNLITEIGESNVPNSVETLLLNNNHIREVRPNTFARKTNLSRVVLYANRIEKMELAALHLAPVPEDRELPQFFIGGNPFYCDCTMEWLQRINQLSHLRQHPRVLDLDSVTCRLAHSRGSPTRPLLDLVPAQFLCPYETHCFALCHCCEFDACDCEMTCPDNCTCYHDHSWASNVVDCSNAGYQQVPQGIPMDATEIYLDGNNLTDLGSHVFIGKKKLQVLYLNGSRIDTIHNRTFNGATSLRVLHMENNHLQELRGEEFDPLKNLNELYLDHNAITKVGNKTFAAMRELEVLRLDDNKIEDFKPWQQLAAASEGGRLAQVSLDGNLWTCDCEHVPQIEAWLRDNTNVAVSMRCAGSTETLQEVVARCSSDASQNVVATSVVQRGTVYTAPLLNHDYVTIVAATLAGVVVVLLVLALVFIFRHDVRLWAYARYGVRILSDPAAEAGDEKDRLYDAYLAYSVKDEDFVSQVVAAELEQSGYSLCLHYRDIHLMSGGASYLADAVLGASDASRRVVLVLSLSFLQNEWARPEFRAALQASLEQKRAAMRRHKVILLLTTALDAVTLDPELQLLLRTCTVISWGEKRFWEKLRYAMPDVALQQRKKRAAAAPVTAKLAGGVEGGPARYTAAPTSLDAWYKYSVPQHFMQPGVHSACALRHHEDDRASTASPHHQDQAQQQLYNYATAPSEQSQHSYVSIDRHNPYGLHHSFRRQRDSHVYSTIPDTSCQPALCRLANGEFAVIQAAPGQCPGGAPGRTYFV